MLNPTEIGNTCSITIHFKECPDGSSTRPVVDKTVSLYPVLVLRSTKVKYCIYFALPRPTDHF